MHAASTVRDPVVDVITVCWQSACRQEARLLEVTMLRFRDRVEAGRLLARELGAYADDPHVLVLALPRGGVPVAFEVARELGAPLDVFVVRKLGVPGHEEFAMGAIAIGGVRLVDEDIVRELEISPAEVEAVLDTEQRELERRALLYRGDRPPPDIAGRTVILVDDGLATGATMRVAVAALRQEHPGRIVVAVPIAPPETCVALRRVADDVVCAVAPDRFYAVGLWYENFEQTTDEEVHDLIERARRELAPAPMPRR
jgi:predicted phosphoribosyltransferase